MPGISILLASRRKGNSNFGLPTFLESLAKKTVDLTSIEILIRFDDDDEISEIIKAFPSYPFSIKYLIGPRGKGYEDLCYYYNQLYPLANPKFNMVMCVADDMLVIEDGWEQKVFKAAKGAKDLFIIHQWLPNLHLSYQDLPSNLHHVDEIPIWSKKLIELTKGIGCVGRSSDSWTIILEWGLKHGFGKSITRYIKRDFPYLPIIDRKICKEDLVRSCIKPIGKAMFSQEKEKSFLSALPEYPQILAISRYKMGLWPYWNSFYLFLKKLIGKVVNQPIDIDGISLHALEDMIYLIEENYYGYNICLAEGIYYGIPQSEGEFLVAKFKANQYFLPIFHSRSLEEAKHRCGEYKRQEQSFFQRAKIFLKKWLRQLRKPVR